MNTAAIDVDSPITHTSTKYLKNPFTWTGQYCEPSTGLCDHGKRWYDSSIGRWVSEEPTGIDGPNLYWYAQNNPTNLIDLTGLAASEVGPLGGGNAPVGPESCASFYGDQCLDNPDSIYYCTIAPSLCEQLIPKPVSNPNSDRSNCIRACLQRKEIEGSDAAGSCGDKNNNFIKHETDIHLECFRACSGTSF